jgi:hypothetical protein
MVLQIVVTPDCFGCDQASRLAALMRREFPALEVELHILTGAEPVPPGVVAWPAPARNRAQRSGRDLTRHLRR